MSNNRRTRTKRQKSSLKYHKASVLGISMILLLLVAVVSVGSLSLKAKNDAYIAQETELEAKIAEQEERAKEIDELEEYVGTDEYVEQVAKDKLGLVYEDEIIFKNNN